MVLESSDYGAADTAGLAPWCYCGPVVMVMVVVTVVVIVMVMVMVMVLLTLTG
jgi:hypothetical protein